jgi:hypothetical protein
MKVTCVRSWWALPVFALLLGCTEAPAGRSASAGDGAPPPGVLPSLEGRALAVGVSGGAGAAGRAWVSVCAAWLGFSPVGAGADRADWEAALRAREIEVAWVRAEEWRGADGLEAGEGVEFDGTALVPVFREGAKWRGAFNAAAKWHAEGRSR